MKPLSDFLTRVQAHVMNCPEPAIAQATLDTCIEFAEKSLVMTERLDPFNTVLNEPDYEVYPPPHTRVARFKKMWIDGADATLLPREMVGSPAINQSRPTTAYTRKSNGQFFLTFTAPPDGAYRVDLEAALVPTRTATQVDDDYFELWVDAIVAGTIARLKLQPNVPWTDPAMAGTHQAKFLTELAAAKREANLGRVAGSLSVSMRPFAGGFRK